MCLSLLKIFSDQSKFVKKLWKDVRVGDFIRLGCDETIPADMLLLWSSDEDNLCYIQTSNLDGETNLKQRQVPVGIVEKLREEDKQSYDSKLDQVGLSPLTLFFFCNISQCGHVTFLLALFTGLLFQFQSPGFHW